MLKLWHRSERVEVRAGLEGAGRAAFINTHSQPPHCHCLHPTVGFLPVTASHIGFTLLFSSSCRQVISWILVRLELPTSSCHHFASDSHVQLQLLPGQVWLRGEGASAQIQREELRLLHEDHLLLLLSDPVPHHRQPGALPHLRTTGTICRGEESQGQCEDSLSGVWASHSGLIKNVNVMCFFFFFNFKELELGFNKLSDNNIQLMKDKSELGAQLGARTAEKAAVEKELEKMKTDSNATEVGLKQKLVSTPTLQNWWWDSLIRGPRDITNVFLCRTPVRKEARWCVASPLWCRRHFQSLPAVRSRSISAQI